jgi:signal transduction histidine kinase
VRVRDRFFSVAAHELKTPLTTLFGQAQLLQRRMFSGVVDPERDIRAINRVVEQGRRMHQLIDALLDVPRLETGRITIARLPIDLRQLVQQLVEDIEPTLERHRLTTVYPAEPLLVSGDPMRLSQVFQNLLQNAVKYSPSGGTISVSGIVQDGSARIAIADQGIGIPADVLPNLFQQFYRAANAEQHLIGGLGLGLYVVRELLLLHGGTITVESVEGKGSIFTVELPLAR